jgi:hypothetical protein
VHIREFRYGTYKGIQLVVGRNSIGLQMNRTSLDFLSKSIYDFLRLEELQIDTYIND